MNPSTDQSIIHINWAGPYTLQTVANLTEATDFGVYQIYGPHPVYGNVQLLYIGLASEQKFGVRIPQHPWCQGTRDPSKVEVYVGRLCGVSTPNYAVWTEQIRQAERLLIYAHYPPFNTQKEIGALEPTLRTVHVLNWFSHRDLFPEVSGARWSNRFEDIPGYRPYDNREMPPATP